MAPDHQSSWSDQLSRFGLKSLVKLVFGFFALLIFAVLVSLLPGLARLNDWLPIRVFPLVQAGVTLVLLVLLYKIATQANTIITQIETNAEDVRDTVASVVYWAILLLAVAIAYIGFQGVGEHVFEAAGFAVFYPLFFVLMALIPVAFLLMEIGVFVQTRRVLSLQQETTTGSIQTNEEQVYRLLEAQDGMLYQTEVADATGWSDAKASRILSEMEAAGTITRHQIGRQKIVYLAGHEPPFTSAAEDTAVKD